MPAYWIAHANVTEPEAYARYAKLATQALLDHGGRILARGGAYVQLEGTERGRHVVVEFPSLEAAEACYRSEAYQAALDFARGAAERDLLIVEGVAP